MSSCVHAPARDFAILQTSVRARATERLGERVMVVVELSLLYSLLLETMVWLDAEHRPSQPIFYSSTEVTFGLSVCMLVG